MKKNNRGFTLVELLAVSAVMVVVSVIVTATITSSLRGTTKTNTINDVRQNGNYAIAQVSKMIEYAKSFNGVSNDYNGPFDSNCTNLTPSLTPTPTPSQYSYIKITGFDNGQTIFGCSQNNVNTIASNSAFLIDTSLVSVDSCSFTCERARITDSPIIGINFSLSKKTTSNLFENKASVSFKTSVKMRNLNN